MYLYFDIIISNELKMLITVFFKSKTLKFFVFFISDVISLVSQRLSIQRKAWNSYRVSFLK